MATGGDQTARVFVALGTNLGDRSHNLDLAVERLGESDGIEVVARSRTYETDPLGPPGQAPYLNAVVELRTRLGPRALLERLLALESLAGRERDPAQERWGPRVLDLDLLLYDESCLDDPDLTIPHPRLHERGFVLEPLCDLAPELRHPRLGERIGDLARKHRDPGAVRLFTPRPERADEQGGT